MSPEHLQALLGPDGCLGAALAAGETVVLRVDGGCMEPDLHHGATVQVARSRFLWPGDVVAFHCPYQKRFLMHRCLGYVRSRGAWKVMTMADRGASPDVLAELPRVLGRIGSHAGAPYRAPVTKRLESVLRYLFWSGRFLLRRHTRSAAETA